MKAPRLAREWCVRYIRTMNRAQYVTGAPYTRALEWRTDADNTDLVRMVIQAARTSWPLLQPLPRFVKRSNAPRVAWSMGCSVDYIREDGDQLVRLPWRTLADGVADCKSLAVLTSTLCRAAGCDTVLRFVRYAGDDHYAHVYTVADGVCVDPELPYGHQVPHASAYDVRL